MPSPDAIFLEALSTFERQVGEATQFWFTAAAINEVSKKDRKVFAAFQLTPTFWMTVRGGLEHQAIVAIGRIFGQRSANPVNIDSLMQVVRESLDTVFPKSALAVRKATMSLTREQLNALVDGAHALDFSDFKRMNSAIAKYRRIYQQQFAAIRNQYVAHTDKKSTEEIAGMFKVTRIRDFELMLAFLNTLHTALWHAHQNGLKPNLRLRRSSVRALVNEKLQRLGRGPLPEDTVRQTRQCLAFLANGAAATHSTGKM
jgi:hypothetical protein